MSHPGLERDWIRRSRISEAKPQEDSGVGIFFGGTAMVGVFSAASWAVLHFVGNGVTLVF